MILLDQFVLQHVQYSLLHAELHRVVSGEGSHKAKVELNLTPRVLKADSGNDMPAYQLSARLTCTGTPDQDAEPAFTASVALEAIYQQISGEPVDVADFSREHTVLARQVYPLLQQRLRDLLANIGLTQFNLPFDLAPRSAQEEEGPTVKVSQVLH